MAKFINRNLLHRSKIVTSIKRSRVFLLYFIMFSVLGIAQINLVLNPSFEQLDSCPNYYQRVDLAKFWKNLNSDLTCASPLLSICSLMPNESGVPIHDNGGGNTYQWPRTGNNYIEVCAYVTPTAIALANFRTYNVGTLSTKLINGKEYCGKLYINLANISPYKSNEFGMYFDNGSVIGSQTSCNSVLSVIPQVKNNSTIIMSDTLNWMKIEGSFIANGTEDHVTIGNFKNDASTTGISTGISTTFAIAVYNIDDVGLIPIEISAFAGKDATICIGDSLNLGRPQETGIECEWYTPGNPIPFSKTSNFTFKANDVGTYTFIQRMDNCKITFDTVTVKVEVNCDTIVEIPNVFTPNEDGRNDAWRFEIKNATDVKYSVYNRWGNLIKDSAIASQTVVSWDGRTTAGEACSSGVYFYVLTYTDAKGEAQKKNGYLTLIK